jgi:hypothetical protein
MVAALLAFGFGFLCMAKVFGGIFVEGLLKFWPANITIR